MRKKLKNEAGLTLVEMLAATVVLVLLALMLNTGLQMMFNTYQAMIAQSELELLLSTAVDALADDLRYAWDYDPSDSAANVPFTYSSDSYGEQTQLDLDGEGRIIAKSNANSEGWQVLSTGAYGNETPYKKYSVTELKIEPKEVAHNSSTKEITFTIHLKVETADGNISAETDVTVRCLNLYTPPAGGT